MANLYLKLIKFYHNVSSDNCLHSRLAKLKIRALARRPSKPKDEELLSKDIEKKKTVEKLPCKYKRALIAVKIIIIF